MVATITDAAQPFDCQVVMQVQSAQGSAATLVSGDLVGYCQITAYDRSGKTLNANVGHDGTTHEYIEAVGSGIVSPTTTIRGPISLTNNLFRCLLRAAVSATAASGTGTITYGSGHLDYYTAEFGLKSDVFETWQDIQVKSMRLEGEANGNCFYEAVLQGLYEPSVSFSGITLGSDRPQIGAITKQHQCTYEINSVEQAHKSWSIEIDNPIEAQHYDQVYPSFHKWSGKRAQTLECSLAYCDESETVRDDLNKSTNRIHVITLNDGTNTLTVTANDTAPEEVNAPTLTDSVEDMTVRVKAYADKTNATDPLVMVLA